MAAVIANEFAEAADSMHLSALVEIGLVLFVMTLIINYASRLLIWSMAGRNGPGFGGRRCERLRGRHDPQPLAARLSLRS